MIDIKCIFVLKYSSKTPMRILFALVISSFFFLGLSAQEITLSGYVKDGDSGETMIGATVFVPSTGAGNVSNEYGFYSISLPVGDSVLIQFSYIGYQNVEKTVIYDENANLDIELTYGQQLQEVVVKADSYREVLNSTQMSVEQISMEDAKLLPALFGEVDIIKTLQLKPGVSSGGEGTSGLSVRGGTGDQNLFLLDEATVYNPQHLFGFFSTFNSDAVKNVELYKGGFPAQYGGRLSSVVDVKLRDGNRKKFAGSGGLGLIASRLTLEGPIARNQKGSFIVSGRRTYVDLFTSAANKRNEDNPDFNQIPAYFFYDLNGKINYDLGKKDKIFVSGYFGKDKFGFRDDDFNFDFNWGNIALTARWNHVYNSKLFSNTTLTFSDYEYQIKNRIGEFATFELGSGIRDYTGKIDYFYSPDNKHNIKFGGNITYHQFEVGRLSFNDDDNTFNFQAGQDFDAWAFAGYIADDWEVTDDLKVNYGLRLSAFYNDKFYVGVEPRFSLKYSVNPDLSLKASYAYMTQYIHLVTNSSASLPTDVWYPSNENIKPQRSQQVAGGLAYTFDIGEQNFLVSNEAYYKWGRNLIDFRDGAQLFVNDNLDDEFVFGTGNSYGNEIYLEKQSGKIRGWIGYTLSWTWREFPDILEGRKFHPTYDRRHDISTVLIYNINKRWSTTASWVYTSGALTTLPFGSYAFADVGGSEGQFPLVEGSNSGISITPIYTDRNSIRLAPNHRLDLGLIVRFFPKWGESDLTISTYNTYNRLNPFFVFIDTVEDADGNFTGVQAKQVSLFPILPSITWNFKF